VFAQLQTGALPLDRRVLSEIHLALDSIEEIAADPDRPEWNEPGTLLARLDDLIGARPDLPPPELAEESQGASASPDLRDRMHVGAGQLSRLHGTLYDLIGELQQQQSFDLELRRVNERLRAAEPVLRRMLRLGIEPGSSSPGGRRAAIEELE